MAVNTLLLQALDEIFVQQRQTLSEYNLIGVLQREPYLLLAPEAMREPLELFRCHFVLFHHLYLLQDACFEEGKGRLEIHTTRISLSEATLAPSDVKLRRTDPLRLYYLDWSHFDETQKEDVDALLDAFWSTMQRQSPVSDDEKHRALAYFSLSEPFNLKQLKSQYLNLQHQCHPDKGGSVEQSQALQQAYKVLKKVATARY